MTESRSKISKFRKPHDTANMKRFDDIAKYAELMAEFFENKGKQWRSVYI